MTQKALIYSLRVLVVTQLKELLFFPIWWYSQGLKKAFLYCLNLLKSGHRILAIDLWLKNIFVPMFAQVDWQGRLISFFMRIVQIIFRSIGLLGWLVLVVLLFLVWIILPIIIIYQLYLLFLGSAYVPVY